MNVASCSFGKDSLAMCLLLIEEGYPLDTIVFYDTGMEFSAIYKERDKFVPYFKEHGIEYVELHPVRSFLFDMFVKPVHRRDGTLGAGYGWCGGTVRWGTTAKNREIDRFVGHPERYYIGIAADEDRPRMEGKEYPLIDWGMSERDCLDYCYAHGAIWNEGGVPLYDVLDRVSCWCCRNKNLHELKQIHDNLPEYWERLLNMESRLGQMKKSKPLSEIGKD